MDTYLRSFLELTIHQFDTANEMSVFYFYSCVYSLYYKICIRLFINALNCKAAYVILNTYFK